MISTEYIAGFFDGEGCVSLFYFALRKKKSDPSKKILGMRLVVLVSNTEPEVLRLIQAVYGGHLHISNKRRKATHKPVSSLRFSNAPDQRRFLAAILPFSITKREAIKIGLVYLQTSKMSGHRPTQEEWTKRIECIEALKLINKRGDGQGHAIPVPPSPAKGHNPLFR